MVIINENKTRLELLFKLYEIGRKIKFLSKKGNKDQALETLILRYLSHRDMDVTELSKVICANMSSVSESVEKLEQQKLIVKKCCTKDKRKMYAQITSKGKKVLSEIEEMMNGHCISFLIGLNDDEVGLLLKLLDKVSL